MTPGDAVGRRPGRPRVDPATLTRSGVGPDPTGPSPGRTVEAGGPRGRCGAPVFASGSSSGSSTGSSTGSASGERGRRYAPGDVNLPTPTQVKVLVPGDRHMVELLGERDELLRLVESSFPVSIHVRGNEITVTGEEQATERVGALFEELVLLLERGHTLDPEVVRRTVRMVERDQRPSEVLSTEVLRGRRTVRPKTGGQKRYTDAIAAHTVTFGIGPAGTGKSYLAVAAGVQALQAKSVNRIILTRPAVEAGERLGFLPGDILAKVDPYLRPLYDALHDMLEAEAVSRLMERGTIEVAPLAFMRGRTLNDSFIILDEAQNTTPEQMKMFLTRLGFGSRMVITGDVTQIDLPEGRGRSGLRDVRTILTGVPDVAFVELDSADVVRHRIVQDIVDAYERSEQ